MTRYVAFLRGMNTGRRRVKNEELCAVLRELGHGNVSAFLASGNLIFDAAGGTAASIAARIETGLEDALGYDVQAFLRTASEVRAIATVDPFARDRHMAAGKPQVAFLRKSPGRAQRERILALATDTDRLAFGTRELHWLPIGRLTDSELDWRAIETVLGATTTRAKRTVERIAARHL